MIYVTRDGDMLDQICRDQLGAETHLPAVLSANPHLADLGEVYSYGIIIQLPEVSAPVTSGQIRLWGRT